MLDLSRFTHLSFDCYGTLIDWESGLLGSLRPLFPGVDDARLLQLYAWHEAAIEAGPFRCYRDVLRGSAQAMGTDLAIQPTPAQLDAFADSLGSWPPFPDTVAALGRLEQRYELAILSNVDDDLFARTAALLQVPFAAVITAQQVGSYKPSPANFGALLVRLGTTADRVLHVAQSLYHDHVPAKQLGFSTVWVNRASRLPGTGVTLPAQAQPDLTVPDLATLSARLCP